MTRRLWLFMFCVIALGVCGPVALTTWVSREYAEELLRQRVDQFTARALVRVEVVARDAIQAARQADTFAGTPRSEEHTSELQSH